MKAVNIDSKYILNSLVSFLSAFASSRGNKGFRSVGLLLLYFIATSIAYAQPPPPYLSNNKWFQVDQIKGCAPFTVTVTNLLTQQCLGNPTDPPGVYSNCQVYYIGTTGPFVQNTFTHVYTTPGTYRLLVNYPSIKEDYIDITVVGSTDPLFEVYTCGNNKVSLKITDTKYDDYFVIDMDNDNTPEFPKVKSGQSIQYSYPANISPVNYTIAVRGVNKESADNCAAITQPFTTVPGLTLPTPTITTLTAIDAGTLKLDFPTQPNMQLRSEIAVTTGNFQQYQSLYGLNTTNMTSLRVDDNYYCFRLNNYDPCANANNYSAPICSQNFDLTIENGVNKLNWSTNTAGINSVTIQRNVSPNTTIIPLAPLSYDDTDVICKTNYCYKVISNYTGANSVSLEKCGVAFKTTALPIINNISSIVNAPQGATLTWLADASINAPQFNVYRSAVGGPFALYNSTPDLSITDNDYTSAAPYCYKIDYEDGCGNKSDEGISFCPIRLDGTLEGKNISSISWNDYFGWINGVNHYVVEKYSTDGQLLGTTEVGTTSAYKDDPADPEHQVVRYIVKAYANEAGVTLSASNEIEIIKNTNLFSPTAFTPNGDNLNDTFYVIGYYITKLKLKVFDRWGVLVYSSDNNIPWNGNRDGSGQPMPAGAYVWKAETTDFIGRTLSEEGTVMLIRKNN